MAEIKELLDLHSDYWGNKFISANDRLRNTEKLLDYVTHLAFPRFESEIWTPARTYKPFTFVHDSEGNSYVSLTEVPSGVDITNIAYWRVWDVRDGYIQSLKATINKLEDDLRFLTSNVANHFTFKGDCKYSELPTSGNNLNDTYYCTDKKCRYSWNGTEWYQSSMDEAEFQEELDEFERKVEGLFEDANEKLELDISALSTKLTKEIDSLETELTTKIENDTKTLSNKITQEVNSASNKLTENMNALGLSVVNGMLCVTYTK